jgi:hypothetical protein
LKDPGGDVEFQQRPVPGAHPGLRHVGGCEVDAQHETSKREPLLSVLFRWGPKQHDGLVGIARRLLPQRTPQPEGRRDLRGHGCSRRAHADWFSCAPTLGGIAVKLGSPHCTNRHPRFGGRPFAHRVGRLASVLAATVAGLAAVPAGAHAASAAGLATPAGRPATAHGTATVVTPRNIATLRIPGVKPAALATVGADRSAAVHPDTTFTVTMTNQATGRCVDDSFGYGLRAFGCNGQNYQRWLWIAWSDGTSTFVNENTGRAIDDSLGYGLRSFTENDESYQSFYL